MTTKALQRPLKSTRIKTQPDRRRSILWFILLSILLVLASVVSIITGPSAVNAQSLFVLIFQPEHSTEVTDAKLVHTILFDIRIPRTLLGIFVGVALAVSGAVLQAVVRNILADPYILGVSAGASTGASALILFGFGAGVGSFALPVSAFIGAMISSLLVFFIAQKKGGGASPYHLLLSGVAIGYALSSITSFLVFMSDSAEGSRSVMFWLLGSLSFARNDISTIIIGILVIGCAVALTFSGRILDSLAVGDEFSSSIGINPYQARLIYLIIVSILTGIAVAFAGAIGFVGLVIPHLARFLVGHRNRLVIPISALLGAIFLVSADTLSRIVVAPRELPIGILTAIVGAPFLLILVRRSKNNT